MERPPAYLIWFVLRMRGHADDPGFLPARFADMPIDRMEREVAMLDEAAAAGLLLLDSKTLKKPFATSNSAIARRYGEDLAIPYPASFALAPGGHYLVREAVAQGLLHVLWTVVAAMLGGIVALGLAQVLGG